MNRAKNRIGIIAASLLLIVFPIQLNGQSEASGIFLLIPPGARAGGMGEAQVAMANDAFASYWNPAGLANLRNRELTAMHVNWLPGLTNDMFYEFLAYRHELNNLGTIGGHFSYMNLGEQGKTTLESGPDVIETFRSYMWNVGLSYGTLLTRYSSAGVNFKIYQQFLAPASASELFDEDAASTNFAFDLSYLNKRFFSKNLRFGAALYNLGPKSSFYDEGAGDPSPTAVRVGLNWVIFHNSTFKFSAAYDLSKLLVAETDNDEEYSLVSSIFRSLTDEPLQEEWSKVLHNFGVELWINNMLAIRGGGFYQGSGDLHKNNNTPILTFGAGLRYEQYGFDVSYISSGNNNPLNNTTRFSLNFIF